MDTEVTITRSDLKFKTAFKGVRVQQVTQFRGPRTPNPDEAAGATTHAINHLMKELMGLGFTHADLDNPELHVTPHADGYGLQVDCTLHAWKVPVEIVAKEIISGTKH